MQLAFKNHPRKVLVEIASWNGESHSLQPLAILFSDMINLRVHFFLMFPMIACTIALMTTIHKTGFLDSNNNKIIIILVVVIIKLTGMHI